MAAILIRGFEIPSHYGIDYAWLNEHFPGGELFTWSHDDGDAETVWLANFAHSCEYVPSRFTIPRDFGDELLMQAATILGIDDSDCAWYMIPMDAT